MANIYIIRNIDNQTWLNDIAGALSDFYGGNLTVHNITAAVLIFNCPLICNKDIRIIESEISVGNYVSGTDLQNKQIVNTINGGRDGTVIVCSNKFLVLSRYRDGDEAHKMLSIFAKLSNDNFVAMGYIRSTNRVGYGRNLSTDESVALSVFNEPFHKNNKLFIQPLIIQNQVSGVELNNDGSLAYIDGLYNISYSQYGQMPVFDDLYIFPYNHFLIGKQSMGTSLMCYLD